MVTKLHMKLWVRRTLHLIICLSGGLFLHWCRLKKAVFSSHSQKQEIAFETFSRTKSGKNLLNALDMSGIYPFNTRWSWNVTQVSSKHSHVSHSLQVKMVINLPSLAAYSFNVFLFLYSGIMIYTVISGINAFRCVTSHIRGGGGCKYFLIFSSWSIQYLLQQEIMSIAGGSVSGKRYIIEKWKNKWIVVIA